MGQRGPAPKPTPLRVLHGDRKDRINNAEPVPSTAPIRPPRWLSKPARVVWRAYAPDLQTQGVLTAWDVEALAIWCDAVVRRRAALEQLEELGPVREVPIIDKDGELVGTRLVKNPWTFVLTECDAQVQRYGARFGLTPSDRSQLKVGGSGRRDPKEDLLT